MAVSPTIWTYFEGEWIEGSAPVIRAADHTTWAGTLVFDGARRHDGVTPDLDRHCERVNHSAEVMGMNPTHHGDQRAEGRKVPCWVFSEYAYACQ